MLYSDSILDPLFIAPKTSPLFPRRLKLISTLLLGVPADRMTDLLSIVFSHVKYPYPTPIFQYHMFIKRITLHNCGSLYEGEFYQPHRQPPQKFRDYVDQHGLMDRYYAEAPLARLTDESYPSILTITIMNELRKDLTWALCTNMERISFISIAISDIGRYLTLINQFKALTAVNFILERHLHDEHVNLDELTSMEQTILAQQLNERTRHLEQMIVFVKEHQRIHPGVLLKAACFQVHPHYQQCSEEYEEQLSLLLPPLHNPRVLNDENWIRFATNIKGTNLSRVELINRSKETGKFSLSRLHELSPFLHRCQSLKCIFLSYEKEDIFQWAVEERRKHDADVRAGNTPLQPLAPLAHVFLGYKHSSNGRLINSVGYAFGDTIEILNIHNFSEENTVTLPSMEKCSIGFIPESLSSCWNLPRLSNMFIHLDNNFLCIHPKLLTQCQNLTSVMLEDRRQTYVSNDIISYFPAELPHLETLLLVGTPALSFHPDTLHTTPRLTSMFLSMEQLRNSWYIPPLDELNGSNPGQSSTTDGNIVSTPIAKQNLWTWDWNLPNLTELDLEAEFAFKFQFKMLQGTPKLEKLRVTINSISWEHSGKIDSNDFLHHAKDSDEKYIQGNDNNNSSLFIEREFISVSALESLSLNGSWTMGHRTLMTLCEKVAPNLRTMSLLGCNGFSLDDLVSVTSKHMVYLETVSVSHGELTSEQVLNLGLIRTCPEENIFHLKQLPENRNENITYYVYG
ncbi:hypothetical protein FBU30_005169 [Linnemannia zychae]|nr:hypothetical protein FBU30_005169 [Linnemannia zychae]